MKYMYVYIHLMYNGCTQVFEDSTTRKRKTALYIQISFMWESSYMFQQKMLKLRAALMSAFFVFNVFVCGADAKHVRLPYWDLPAIYYWKGIAIFLFLERLIAILHHNIATYYLIAVLQLIYFFFVFAMLQYLMPLCNIAILQ